MPLPSSRYRLLLEQLILTKLLSRVLMATMPPFNNEECCFSIGTPALSRRLDAPPGSSLDASGYPTQLAGEKPQVG
jgi:hypothetical protein